MGILEETISLIRPPDPRIMEKAQARLDDLTKPRGSLGRLEELAKQIAGITGSLKPPLDRKAVLVMAGDHGVAQEGVSAYPREVTMQMVLNFLAGGAAINVLARHIGAEVYVADMGVAAGFDPHPGLIDRKVAPGTASMTAGPAMDRKQAAASIEGGIDAAGLLIDKGFNIIGAGDMGIGNTTASSAITSVICGADASMVTGLGTGIQAPVLEKKIKTIEKAISINNPDPGDAIDVLSKVGGFEIGGIAGAILCCAARSIPVVIDGFISAAGALIANAVEPGSSAYMIPSHCSVERGHRIALSHLGLKPLFDLDMRLGEGTGAAIGISIAEAAVKIMDEMATFSSAGISGKEG